MTLKNEALENTVEKGENAGNQHFLIFPQYFLSYQREKLSFRKNLFSVNPFNLVMSKILLFGKGLTLNVFKTVLSQGG